MKKITVVLIATLLSSSAFAATAYWTGRQEMVTTVTYKMGWNCEYQYAGKKFWLVFTGRCPSSVDVE
jgi:hypothetical protein